MPKRQQPDGLNHGLEMTCAEHKLNKMFDATVNRRIARSWVIRPWGAAAAALLLMACTAQPPPLLGTSEWDRIGIAAEAAEPILQIDVHEGDQVVEGQPLLMLDARRTQAQFAQAEADSQRLSAQLRELRRGSRSEVVAAADAALRYAKFQRDDAHHTLDRQRAQRDIGAISQAAFEQAETAWHLASTDVTQRQAQLDELRHGTRAEEIEQAEAALLAAQSIEQRLSITLARMTVRAPRAGRIDALPYKLGDQPPAGATVVSILVGEAPYARVFVPESQRAGLAFGARFQVRVDGVAAPFEARLRSIRSEASFTPYFALSGDDASRLSYRAELQLSGEAAQHLPAGVPLQAERLADGSD
ncbi:MAG: HlyD family efflux transporter periplasmic adaptor subunit [Nevskia sp.]|nr:HlyD family efflux transporter periplasmic adaptor subunit [Nevskia sp.]MCK9385716.1 HlyD family efflux transporter periplasmic adaptor subunit [Nevskia sp.]